MIVVAPELVTPAPPKTAKLSAVAPNSGVADAVEQHPITVSVNPHNDPMFGLTIIVWSMDAGLGYIMA